MTLRSHRRDGFTLLEMILALLIGLFLMGAVYTMFDRQFAHSKGGREATQEATMVRSILARISNDIAGCLGPYDPKQIPDASATSGESTSSGATTASTASTATVQFNYGIQGSSSELTVCSTRVPRELIGPDKRRSDVSGADKVSDLRRISYWLVEGQGLAHQEVKRVTGENADQNIADTDQLIKYIPEVKAIRFQFWDGATWTSSWDSNSPGADGETPIGPPAAVEIVIELFNRTGDEGSDAKKREYRHVVSVPTGNNYSTPQTQ